MGTQKSTNERDPFLFGYLDLSSRYNRFCSALAALAGQVYKIFFPTVHYFHSFVPIAQQARPAAVLGRLSLRMCLWSLGKNLYLFVISPYLLFPKSSPLLQTVIHKTLLFIPYL
jgi:hypothetical protein